MNAVTIIFSEKFVNMKREFLLFEFFNLTPERN